MGPWVPGNTPICQKRSQLRIFSFWSRNFTGIVKVYPLKSKLPLGSQEVLWSESCHDNWQCPMDIQQTSCIKAWWDVICLPGGKWLSFDRAISLNASNPVSEVKAEARRYNLMGLLSKRFASLFIINNRSILFDIGNRDHKLSEKLDRGTWVKSPWERSKLNRIILHFQTSRKTAAFAWAPECDWHIGQSCSKKFLVRSIAEIASIFDQRRLHPP